MKLVKNNSVYTFPAAPMTGLTKREGATRADEVDKAQQHGSIMTGDGQVESTTYEVEVDILADSKAEYRAAKNELLRYAYRTGQKLYVDDDQYINVACLKKWAETWYDSHYMEQGTITLTFLATDPFVYADTATTVTQAITASPTSFIVNNPGNVDVPVTITITNSADNTSMSLVNESDDDRTFGYVDASFLSGTVLVVDSIEGTVTRGSTNTLNDMGGTFLRLMPGDNTLTYTGGACTIQIEFNERWL